MLRKAKLALFTDMVLTALIIIVLFVGMIVIFSAKKNIEHKAFQDSIDWEADYLALTVLKTPSSTNELLGAKISFSGVLGADDKKLLDEWLGSVLIPLVKDGKPKKNSFDSVSLAIVIDDKVVYCDSKLLTVAKFSPCALKSNSILSSGSLIKSNDLSQEGLTHKEYLNLLRERFDDIGARAAFSTLKADHTVSSVVVVQ